MRAESVDNLFARFGPSYQLFVTVTGMTASFVMVISGGIVTVAVPDVMGTFGIGLDQAQLMTTAFNVAMTTSQLLNAWVIAVFGQRIGFTATLIIFSIGSLICGFAEDYSFVVLGRTMQGFSAGVIQPLVMVTIFQVFPSDRRGAAMGLYGMALSLALLVSCMPKKLLRLAPTSAATPLSGTTTPALEPSRSILRASILASARASSPVVRTSVNIGLWSIRRRPANRGPDACSARMMSMSSAPGA